MAGAHKHGPAFDPARLKQRLAEDASALRIGLADAQLGALVEYVGLMQRWNATYNLTAIRYPEQMLSHHVVDSLAVLPEFAQRLQGEASIVDVGSGGGLPGVVLAVANPDWRVRCIDAVEKKTAFVRQVAAVLKLPNLQATHARVETIEPLQADLVTSRAFASLHDFVSLSARHVKPHGVMAAMKGVTPEDEIVALHDAGLGRVEGVTPLQVPRLDAHRCIVWIHPTP